MRYLLMACLALLWATAQASTTIYQLRMTTRPTPPPAPLPPVNQVLYTNEPLVLLDNGTYIPYYGYESLAAAGYGGGRIVPAPLVATAPGYVPVLIRPTAPPVMRLRWGHPGVIMEPDPHFYRYYTPQGPNFRTNGTAVYGVPNESTIYLYERHRRR
jgi:hypothetical protein